MNLKQALALGTQALDAQVEARLESEILLALALGKSRTWIYTWPEQELDATQLDQFQYLLQQRAQGTPIAYLTGYREFWSLDLRVTPACLIPRPETETLVSLALMADLAQARVLDLGTGSGAIALALAHEKPSWSILATDQSAEALQCAQQNAERLGLAERIEFRLGSWFAPLQANERFDLILSNPPYVAEGDAHLQQGDLRYEPRSALSSGKDGLDDLKQIIAGALCYLLPEGRLMVEHGFDQAKAVQTLFQQAGFANVSTQQDDNGLDRVTLGSAS